MSHRNVFFRGIPYNILEQKDLRRKIKANQFIIYKHFFVFGGS